MLSTPKTKSDLFLASSLCDGLEDNNIRQVATLLLNKDADPNILIPIQGVTPFHLIIGNDSEEFAEEVTKLFLRHNGNPNVRSVDGMTPVHVAAAWGRINILQLLLANGGDPLCLDNDGRSPFHYAFDGKYFQAVTMLANYCQNIQDEDDKPKYNIILDKILIANGGVVAEYVTAKDIVDVHNLMHKNALSDSINSKLDTSSMIVDLSRVSNVYIENRCKSNEIISNGYSSKTSHMPTAQIQNAMQKKKCVNSQVINNISSSLNNCTSDQILYNYNKNEQEKSIATSNSDTSSDLKENECSEYKCYQIKSKSFKIRGKNSKNKDILKLSTRKHHARNNMENSSKEKYKDKIPNKISLATPHILDNSIISMSPNFNTPSRELKKRNTCKTPLTQSNIYNDLIISGSSNLASVCLRKKKLAKTSRVDSLKVFEKSLEYKTQMQHSESNWHKKHIGQSTPRRKKRLSCKFYSGKKKFDFYQYEIDMTSGECNNILKPVNLDKTIFFETSKDTSRYDILDMSSKFSSLNLKQHSERKQQGQYNNHLAIKLDEGRYDESDKTENNDVCLLDASSNFYQVAKENKFVNNFNKSETNEINAECIVMKKKKCNNDEKSVNTNIKSLHMTESDSLQNENFVDCIDCDTRNLLNEDLIMNISRTCNLHVKNWRSDKFYTSPVHKSFIENNSLAAKDLFVQCKKQIHLLDCQKLCSSKSTESKESLWTANDFDIHKAESNSSLSSYVSSQEYKYEDPEEGVILLERRLCVTPFSSSSRSESDRESKMVVSGASNISRVSSSLPEEILFIDDVTLRQKLGQLGDQPGPITNTTRQLYQKRLLRLRSVMDANAALFVPNLQNSPKNHTLKVSNKVKPHLELGNWLHHLDTYKNLEKQVFQEFTSPDPSRRWREGTAKTSFTYLLLDPRITQDLPNHSTNLTKSQVWSIFLNSIFYIGKGKCSRPFAHLYEAFKTWVNNSTSTNKKIDYILNIWNSDYGVICLHVFQNIIPVEAYTREAVMIDAIGKEQLKNVKGGEYYGIAATWGMQQKQKFGRYLLYKAFQIFLQEGESQLFPYNL